MSRSQANSYLKVSTPAGADALILNACRGEEALSTPFHFALEMDSDKADLDFSKIVGKPASVTIETTGETKRFVHGIITRLVQGGTNSRVTAYHGELRPWFWLLTLASDHRVFQDKSVIDIVKAVFGDLGFADFKDATTGSYQPRAYAVQYGETAFDFVSRLLEEEGIHYYFEHTKDKHTLVLADDSSAHATCPGPTAIRYGSGSDRVEDDMVTSCLITEQVTPTAYTLDDFEFTTPATDLAVTVTGASAKFKRYDYPGGYAKNDRGDALAKIRLEACEAEAKSLTGSATVRTFTPGFTFTLKGHGRSDANGKYLLRRVMHSATLDGYANEFEAMPATVSFRPPLRTAKPRIGGAQTAIVVGKSGEEIWTDEYGRIKVQFHWDRTGEKNEKSSCWVRVAQGWAGKSWGAIFTPRIGQEVVVSFLDGDPDRPIVTGSVYNAQQTAPYPLPAQQTKSTIKSNSSKGGGGSNEFRFEDKKDAEEVYLHAQKDLLELVEHDRTATVKNDDTLTVTKKRTITVSEGDETHTVSKGKRTLAVTAGDETRTVGGKRGVDVTGDEKHVNAAKFTHEVKGDYVLKISGKLTIEAEGAIAIKSGASLATEAGTALTNKAGSDLTNEAGKALTNKGTQVTNEASAALTNKGATVTNDASGQLNNKAGGMQNVEAGGILVVKGSLVKIN